MIASENKDGVLGVRGMATGQLIVGPLDVSTVAVTSLEFSPDGNCLASGSVNGNMRIWNTVTWELIPELSADRAIGIVSIASSPGSSCVAGRMSLSAAQSRAMSSLVLMRGPVAIYCLSFTSDGLHIVSSDDDDDILITTWDADGAHLIWSSLRCPERCEGGWTRLTCSRDGLRIVSCFGEDMIRVWDVSGSLQSSRDRSDGGVDSLSEWISDSDGWIVGGGHDRRDLVIRIPHDLRPTLCQFRNTAVLNCKFFTKLDFTCAALGDLWSKCFVSPQ
ncbi:hypothetical protein ACEPAF_2074 [Sanghuangporus sanghuang]